MEDEVVDGALSPVKVTTQNFDDKLRELRVLRETEDEQSKALKETKTQVENLSYWLSQYMLNSGIKSIVLDGTVYTQKQKVYSKVEDKEALRQWILENEGVDLLMTVHPAKLTAYCNEQLESGGTTPAGVNPNFIKYFVHSK